MASMYKRNGIWYAKWYVAGKSKRMSLKTSSIQRARAKLVEIEEALSCGRPVGHKTDCEIDEFTKAYHAFLELHKRPYTAKTLRHGWKQFCEWAKCVRLSDITPQKVSDYKTHLISKGYNLSTVRSSLLALSSVFKTALSELHLLEGDNPVKGVGLPKAQQRKADYLKTDEIEKLLAEAEAHSVDMYLLVGLGIYSGMRKNELINARWGWIDFEQKLITIRSNGTFQTKSGNDRSIPLAKRLREILTSHWCDNPEQFILYPDYCEKGGTKYRCDFTEAFETVCKRAKVTRCTPHLMRHTFASQLAIGGVSLFKIGEWLGHADPKTTKIYSHLCPQDGDIDRIG